ncbi:hypothetical protein EFA69_03270 [Rufibacter immobilis]|uniref:Uncharacterized protein n=1 Tax=Rufibacter immobilis TaxID=1348778 RepID=A0A3M9N4V9_9BACT|nr:hypothetical protein [Rufibacter immobilis]RNI32357.1 hypothetical protein EFA69_03270 [Rufibacter immobilis]
MKPNFLLLPFLSFLFLLNSCKEELEVLDEIEIKDPQAKIESLQDSISFELDGSIYTFDRPLGHGSGNAQVNLDSVTDKGHPDSVLYWREFKMMNSNFEGIGIRFVKKYSKNQLSSINFMSRPTNVLELYTKGMQPYAVDFGRFNTTDGITIDASLIDSNSNRLNLQTYLPEMRRWLTSIGYDCQENSSFEITNLHKLSTGGYLLEAKFSANLFYFEGKITADKKVMEEAKPKRIKNGYIRLRVD